MSKLQPGANRMGRFCSRAGCRQLATKTLTYIYSDSTAVLGPLATFAEPHAYDLCNQHGARMSAPVGWTVLKQEDVEDKVSGPTADDLMAIADAVREIGTRNIELTASEDEPLIHPNPEIGRRGHLRALPNN